MCIPPLNFMERRGEQLMCHVKSKDIQALKEGMERSGMKQKENLKNYSNWREMICRY